MKIDALWKSPGAGKAAVPAREAAALYEIIRGRPPDDPGRLYRRTRAGDWEQMSQGEKFLKIKAGSLGKRIYRPDDCNR